MVKIQKGNTVYTVTNGAYYSMYEPLGYIIVTEVIDGNENITELQVDIKNQDKKEDTSDLVTDENKSKLQEVKTTNELGNENITDLEENINATKNASNDFLDKLKTKK
ncbi:MAG: hypothetical protein RR708_04390 [Bacilli bacterium]